MSKLYGLTVNDIVELTGMSQVTLNRWVKNGWLKPARDVVHSGPGGGRLFNFMEATAIVYADMWKRMGCSGQIIPLVLERIGGMTFAQLSERIRSGQTYFVPIPPELRDAIEQTGDVWFDPRVAKGDASIPTATAVLFNTVNLV